MPVIGVLNVRASGDSPELMAAFHQGLKDTGFVEGQNVALEHRFAEHQNNRLPALAADLVHRQVSVIGATNTQAALAAKAATTTIPIVFGTAASLVDALRLAFATERLRKIDLGGTSWRQVKQFWP